MINLGGSILKTGTNILGFKVRIILENLCFCCASSQHVQDVLDANAHASNAGTATALAGICSNAIK